MSQVSLYSQFNQQNWPLMRVMQNGQQPTLINNSNLGGTNPLIPSIANTINALNNAAASAYAGPGGAFASANAGGTSATAGTGMGINGLQQPFQDQSSGGPMQQMMQMMSQMMQMFMQMIMQMMGINPQQNQQGQQPFSGQQQALPFGQQFPQAQPFSPQFPIQQQPGYSSPINNGGATRPRGSTPVTGNTPAYNSTPANNNVPAYTPQGSSALGNSIASSAKRTAGNMGSVGYCYRGVKRALAQNGVNLTGGSAYMAADQLARNNKFQETNVPRNQLGNLPAGSVVVWDKCPGHKHGHISVALGNGREASDHTQKQITNYGPRYRVFLPQ